MEQVAIWADIMNHNGSISEILFSNCNSYITGRRTVLWCSGTIENDSYCIECT